MARQTDLKAFQEALAEKLRAAALAESASRLGFESGGTRYLMRLEESGEVLPLPEITTVPLTRPWFMGLANVRGNLISVIDFAAFAGEPPLARSPDSRLVLLADKFGTHSGLVVARMLGLKPAKGFTPLPRAEGDAPWVTARCRDEEGVEWREIDLAVLAVAPAYLDAAA